MLEFAHLIARLTLEQKIRLISGRDFWHTVGIPEIGLRPIRMSDGPSGVRGESFDERNPSISFPSASALSSSWDTELAYRYGQAAGSEAVDKKVQAVLGPTINLHRSPLGGRHFEAYSEDPILTGEIASAFVKGAQSTSVSACPKHYVANDSETDRFTVDVEVDEQTLRELYMRPFEIAIKNSSPWMIMSSYNSVNSFSMSQSPLLETPLKSEWGFDGVVVSDWTAVRTVESAATAQDLAMPGPFTPWNEGLQKAVESGQISEAAIDLKVDRILRLAKRVGCLDQEVSHQTISKAERRELARKAAESGMVLLQNNGILPLQKGNRIAISGDNANRARFQGGGSAQVITEGIITPLHSISESFGREKVSYSVGAELLSDCAVFREDVIHNPYIGKPGARVTFFAEDGSVLGYEDRLMTMFIWNDELSFKPAKLIAEFDLDLSSVTTPDYFLGVGTVNAVTLEVDSEVIFAREGNLEMHDLAAAILQPDTDGGRFEIRGRKSVRVKVTLDKPGIFEAFGTISLMIGEIARNEDPQQLIAKAVADAKLADVAVVFVGTTSKVESEGFDRTTISLPGHQDELVRQVAKANPNTVVIVNSGSPVDLPWRNEVAAILVSWFGGEQMGPALANVLSGVSEPSGRLPTSWVMSNEGKPLNTTPDSQSKLPYTEGINIGYRALAKDNRQIDFPIGFGLGYGQWSVGSAGAEVLGESVRVNVALENSSNFASRGFAAIFASKPQSAFNRSKRWLVGWVRTQPIIGAAAASCDIPKEYFATWQQGWQLESGNYLLEVATHFGASGISLEIQL